MPMVPTFQGNMPQVQDARAGGAVPVRSPQSNFDYESVMKRAMTPVQDFANSAVKALEVERVRVIKAESDDAERQAMGVINTYLNDPENGYLTKQGKDAMDAYGPTMQGLSRDVNAIVGKLSPQARDAVYSRIQDRMMSAQTQAQRWNARQTRGYQLGSSEARVNALEADASNHYADPEYLAKSLASIYSEIDYQSTLTGADPTTVKNLKRAYADKMQATRFSMWGQDDPVSALEALQNTGDSIGAEIRSKIGASLWGSAKKQLGMILSDKYGSEILDKKDFVKRALSGDFSTGIPVIDRLTKTQKVDLFTSALASASSKRGEARASLRVAESNSLATIADTGADSNSLTLDQYVEAYGEKEGTERFNAYKASADTNAASYSYQFMSNEEIMTDVEGSKPSPGDADYAERRKGTMARRKAAENIIKARQSDPIGCAILTEQYQIKPLEFGSEGWREQLTLRADLVDSISSAWGAPKRLLSGGEAKALVSYLDGASVEDRVKLLSGVSEVVGSAGVRLLSEQLGKDGGKYGVAMAGFDMQTEDGMTVGEKYLRGLDAIAQKRVSIDPAAEFGAVAQFNSLIGDEPEDGVAGVFSGSPQAARQTVELARGVYAFNNLNGAGVDYERAIKEAIGGEVVTYQNRKIVLPPGVDESAAFGADIDDGLDFIAKSIKDGDVFYADIAVDGREFKRQIHLMTLKTENVAPDGTVTYSFIRNNRPVFGEGGELFTFELNKRMLSD